MSPSDRTTNRDLLVGPDPGVLASLLAWYDRTRRDLPWRRTTDPYRIWVSEIMLQQTTVPTVLRYFDRFIERFPSLEDLSKASLPDVLKLWEGLGYYQRARNLHRASAMIPTGAEGPLWPRTVSEWMSLPGIGRSTAGAIYSISTDSWAPILDANVRRVTERYFAIPADIRGREALLWEGSNLWGVDNKRPGDTNQALMELGAVLCLPSVPDCSHCPVSAFCRTGERGSGDRMPTEGAIGKKRPAEKPKKPVRDRVVLVPASGPLLFEPRNEGRLLEGLLDISGFSSSGLAPGTLISEGPFRGFRVVGPLFSVRQTYSHFQERVQVILIAPPEKVRNPFISGEARGEGEGARWASLEESSALSLTGVARKIVNKFMERKVPMEVIKDPSPGFNFYSD